MKNFLLALSLLFSGQFLIAQTAFSTAPIEMDVDRPAVYEGGQAAIDAFVAKNQRQLDLRRSEVGSTEVIMEFVVETDGRPTTFRKISADNTILEEEAVVLIQKMRFVPAKKGNHSVRSRMQLTLNLHLN